MKRKILPFKLIAFLFLLAAIFAPVRPLYGAEKVVVKALVVNVRAKPDSSSERVTQLLFNERLLAHTKGGAWTRVSVPDQNRDRSGYLGWVKTAHLARVENFSYDGGNWVIVSFPETKFYESLKKDACGKKIYMGAYFRYLGYRKDPNRTLKGKPVYWVRCKTFYGEHGWIPAMHCRIRKAAPFIAVDDGNAIVRTASMFLDSPYLWGGMTSDGIDCSGLTYMVYRFNGYFIPRDADQQFMAGAPVHLSRLKPGDLVFFGRGCYATHVGIYCGDGWVIHSARSGVVWESLSGMMDRYIGARRMLD